MLSMAWWFACVVSSAEPPTSPRAQRVPVPVSLPYPKVPSRPRCPPSVRELPASPLFEASDARLSGPAVIVTLKEARLLAVYANGRLAEAKSGGPACWPVGLASGYASGHKQRQGDLRTPEGWQRTSDRPWSQFYHALTVHYPGPSDAERGLRDGLITKSQRDAILAAHRKGKLPPMNTRLGGLIAIHGGGGGSDWTLGCIALDNAHIDAMRELLPANMRTDLLVLP